MTKKNVLKWINHIVTGVLIVLFIGIATIVVSNKISGGEPSIFGYQIKAVLSGSMEPGIQTGSIIAVKTGGDMTRFQENDVITFKVESGDLVTHRITEVVKSGNQVMYRTKGDENDGEDINPVLAQNVVAEYTGFTIPYLGYFSEFAKSKNGNLFLLIIPGVLILFYSIFTLWKTISKLEFNKSGNEQIEDNNAN